MKVRISFRQYDRQVVWVSLAFILVLSIELRLPSEANGAVGKTFLLPPTRVGTDLQKKPDSAEVGVPAKYLGVLPASKEQGLKSSLRAIMGTHIFRCTTSWPTGIFPLWLSFQQGQKRGRTNGVLRLIK